MPIQVCGVLVHAMSGTELSRVRTEFRLRLPEPINKSPLESRGADIIMQSSGFERSKNLTSEVWWGWESERQFFASTLQRYQSNLGTRFPVRATDGDPASLIAKPRTF
jgi:hypothetical protein